MTISYIEIYLYRLRRAQKTALKRTPPSSLPFSRARVSLGLLATSFVCVDGDSFTVILAGPVRPVFALIGLLLPKRIIGIKHQH